MAKNRYIDTRFWHDTFIRESLNPLDRYLFLYFLTNDKTNISGIYELPMSIIANETGIEVEMLLKMIQRFEGKIYYVEGWIYVVNFAKYQNSNSPKIKIGIEVEKSKIPLKIKEKIEKLSEKEIPYTYSMDTISHSNSNSNSNTNTNSNTKTETVSSAKADHFEEFWNQYPKKELKRKSREIWNRKKLDSKLLEILKFIDKAKQTDRWIKGFVKQPTTFLNGECWNDDLASYGGYQPLNSGNVYNFTKK